MRVLCVIDSMGSGGYQRQMALLAVELKARGYDVELFLYHPTQNHFGRAVEEAGIPVHEVVRNGKDGFSFKVLWQLIRKTSSGVDVVVSALPVANVYSAFARIFSPTVKLISCEGSSAAAPLSPVRRLSFWWAMFLSSAVVANSVCHAAHLRTLFGLSKKVFAVWNGYEIEKVAPIESGRTDQLLKLLVVARVAPVKNGLRLLQGLEIFQQRHGWLPEVSWAGRRDSDPASLQVQQEMDQFLEDHPHVAAAWTWLGEIKNVRELYQKADGMILPSIYEGLPNVICEAMLAGCPVIASNVCDHPELLGKERERGLLFDPLAPDAICEALEQLNALGLEGRKELASSAREFAQANLSLDRMVDSYERVLSSARSRRA